MAVFWSVVCLLCAACNDLVFKCYARKPRSNGFFVANIGIIWLLTGLWFVRNQGFPADWSATCFWGAVSGFFSIGSNLLMLSAMRTLDAGICSTIFRLNMVPALIGAAVLLKERISPIQFLGIVCALLAVIGFIPKIRKTPEGHAALTGFVLMLIASLMRAAMGLSYSYGFAHQADRGWVVVLNSLFWIIGGHIFARFEATPAVPPEEKKHDLRQLVLYSTLSGMLVSGIVISMSYALACGKASVVLPIMQMSFILTGIMGVIILKEKLTPIKIAAVALGAAAVLILSL